MIFFLLVYVLPNVILYGGAAWIILRVLRRCGIGQRFRPFTGWLMVLGALLLLSTAAGSPYVRDWIRASYRAAHESGYRPYGTAPLPDRIAIEAGDGRCSQLCDEMLARELVQFVDMMDRKTGKVWRFHSITDAQRCADAKATFHPHYATGDRAILLFPSYRAGLAVNRCLAVEHIAQSDAPILVRSFDSAEHPDTDGTAHGYNSKVWAFHRIEIWAAPNQTERRLLASTEGARLEIPFVPLLFTLPFQTHGIGIDGYGGKGTQQVSYDAAQPWEVIGKNFTLPLTGTMPPPADKIETIVQNLAAPHRTRLIASLALRDLMTPTATGVMAISPDPAWLDRIIAALSAPDQDGHVHINLLYALIPYGPTAAAAAPAIRQAFNAPNGDLRAAAILAASALELFSKDDIPWLTKMTKDSWWRTNNAAWAALKRLET